MRSAGWGRPSRPTCPPAPAASPSRCPCPTGRTGSVRGSSCATTAQPATGRSAWASRSARRAWPAARTGSPDLRPDDAYVLPGVGDLVAAGGRLPAAGRRAHVPVSADGRRMSPTPRGRTRSARPPPGSPTRPAGDGRGCLPEHRERQRRGALRVPGVDGGQRYLEHVSYGTYRLEFSYEPRPDVLAGRRRLPGGDRAALPPDRAACPNAQPLVRSWDLGYTQHRIQRSSLLHRVTLCGHAADGSELDGAAADARLLRARRDVPHPVRRRCARPRPGASDGPGRPGRLERRRAARLSLDLRAGAAVWPNLGGCRWGTPRVARAGSRPLARSGRESLADINGDGTADLIAVDRPLARYVPRDPAAGSGGR